MIPRWSLRLVLTLAAAYAMTACSDHPVAAPRAIPVPSYDDIGLDAGPDSGAAVVVSSDGPADARRLLRLAAVAVMPTIRVGVVQSAASIALGSEGDYVLSDKANGLEIARGSGDAVTVTLASKLESNYRLQVMCASVTAVAQRKAAAEAAGDSTLTEFVPSANCTRLYIGKFAPPPEMHAIEERLNRIEQAVDAIAIETERISEGQRFTTRLLSDRQSADANVPAPRPGQSRG